MCHLLLQGTRNMSPEECDRLMSALDVEGDGRLAYRELLNFVLTRMVRDLHVILTIYRLSLHVPDFLLR